MLDKIINFRQLTIWKMLLKVQELIMIVCSTLMIVIISSEVVMRYIFKEDLYGYEEILIIFAMWLYFIGASYAMYQKSHISADMLGIFLKGKPRILVSWIASLIGTVIAVAFAFWAFEFFVWALQKKAATTGLKLPLLYSQSALFFGYVLLAFYSVINTIEDAIGMIKKLKSKEADLE